MRLEQESAKRARRGQLEHLLLGALFLTGVATIALAAPNLLQLLKKFDPNWMLKNDPRRRLREVATRLKKKGWIEFVNNRGRWEMQPTPAGRRAYEIMSMHTHRIPRPKRWDGKWRIVIFDIREKDRKLRNRVRVFLSGFGFVKVQQSVWAFPYDCEETITLLKANLGIGGNLLYMIVDAIEYDKKLRTHYGLDGLAR